MIPFHISGSVVMYIQKLLIRNLLDPLAHFMSRFPAKLKRIVFVGSGMMLFLQAFAAGGLSPIHYRYLYSFAFDCFFLGLMILCTLKEDLSPISFRKLPVLLWLGIGITVLLSGVLNNIDYLPEAVLFLIGFPIIFIVWTNAGIDEVFPYLLKACIYSFLVYLLICVLFFPVTNERYAAFFSNPNGASSYLALVFACLLAQIFSYRKFCVRYILDLALLGICFALVYYTNSRTGQLEALCVFLFSALLYLILYRKKQLRFFIQTIVLAVVSIGLFLNTTVYFLQAAEVFQQFQSEISSSETPGDPTTPDEPATPTDPSLPDTQDPGDNLVDTSAFKELNNSKVHGVGKGLDYYTSGRISVWKSYIGTLNLFGHAKPTVFHIDIINMDIGSTHNMILQMAYNYGIISGFLYLLYNLWSGFASIGFAMRKRSNPYAIMPFAITIAFGVNSLFESMTPSCLYIATLYYHLIQFSLMKPLSTEQATLSEPSQSGEV